MSTRILLSILLTGGGYLAVRFGLLSELGGPVDLGSFLFGVGVTTSIGFIFFQVRVWNGHTRAFFQPRQPSLHAGPSAAQMFAQATASITEIAILCLWVTFVVLEYYGRHDIVVGVLEFLATKTEKLINALTH